ncbi:2'-5' RNA ligase [Carbonactinospora thermoautotrophica]|uniref:RNA 2',3'-cyclic phosphodiesterase n=3 Tax=Carbonactinospora thermoautotrophica TaxID=1469144 RepID=A0A132MYT6_9ACTN|nr:RNA 2',3'-cyclic phosphodiesterase [Carbonactinospora thermoautotrophica]KWX02886.1 2'-5' RNA ligase [Carbonactinospora thermoautotrophica]
MRLFVALIPPGEVVDDLERAVAPLRAQDRTLRWTRAEHWHLTLAFLGEVDEEKLPDLTTRLARAAKRHPAPTLAFTGGGRFGHRVLWTGVTGDRDPLRRLVASVQAAARRAGIPVEERAWRPHLTLARVPERVQADLRPLVERLRTYVGDTWTATELHLVRSRLQSEPRYETLRSWPLGSAPLEPMPPEPPR